MRREAPPSRALMRAVLTRDPEIRSVFTCRLVLGSGRCSGPSGGYTGPDED